MLVDMGDTEGKGEVPKDSDKMNEVFQGLCANQLLFYLFQSVFLDCFDPIYLLFCELFYKDFAVKTKQNKKNT